MADKQHTIGQVYTTCTVLSITISYARTVVHGFETHPSSGRAGVAQVAVHRPHFGCIEEQRCGSSYGYLQSHMGVHGLCEHVRHLAERSSQLGHPTRVSMTQSPSTLLIVENGVCSHPV